MDPSNKSHPLHSLVLSIFESKNQIINSADFPSIKNQLKQCGLIFLLYNDDHNESNKHQDKNNVSLNHQVIECLKNKKIIKNVVKYNTAQQMNYFDLYHKMSSIRDQKPNKVFIIHCKEHHYFEKAEPCVEETIDIAIDLDEDMYSYDEEDEDWLTFEPEQEDQPMMDLAVGGAKDITHFRQCILEQNTIPNYNSITYCGIFYEYYFDKKPKPNKQQDDDESKTNSNELFSPSYFYARNKLPRSNVYDTYISVGLSSNIKANAFKRPELNVVIVLDVSGSMSWSFNSKESDSKMHVAKKCLLELIKHLHTNDRFGLVLFNNDSITLQSLELMSNINMDALRDKIQNIKADGGTNMQCGYKTGVELFEAINNHGDMIDNDEYDENDERLYQNRIIFLTDANPGSDGRNLIQLNKQYSNQWNDIDFKENIYCTFIGIGVDFNDEYVKDICECRGSNYFSVHSNEEFNKIMNDEFDLMVSPILFNLTLEIKSPDNSCIIDSVYGVDNDDEIKSGTVMRIHTLFPSKPKKNTKKSKGGLVVIKLKRSNEGTHMNDINGILNQKKDLEQFGDENYRMEARVDYEYEMEYEFDICDDVINQNENYASSNKFTASVECSKYATLLQKHINEILLTQNDIKEDEKESVQTIEDEKDEKTNTMENEGKFNLELVIKYEDNQHKIHTIKKTVYFEHDTGVSYYDNIAIRKAVLLSNYVKVCKAWIADSNEELVEYIKTEFIPYFKTEAKEIGDEQLMEEIGILNKISILSMFSNSKTENNVVYVHNTDDFNVKEENYGIKQMLLTYNPLQSVITTCSKTVDIFHPMDIYHNAYCQDLISVDHTEIHQIYADSYNMTLNRRLHEALATLIRYEKKYFVILIPISVTLNDSFLNNECIIISSDYEKLAEYGISFIYRQFIYVVKQSVMEQFIHDQDQVTVYGYIRNQWSKLEMQHSFLPNEVINLITVWYKTEIEYTETSIIRLLQKRCSQSGSDNIQKWLNIGCESLFLCDINKDNEINVTEPKKKILKLLFLCKVDCRIPYNEEIIDEEFQCAICMQLMIDPSNIGHPECKHTYCYNCIERWSSSNVYYNQYCPICRIEINEITLQQDLSTKIKANKKIPTVIYSQLVDEHFIICKGQKLLAAYHKEREAALQQLDNREAVLQQLNNKYKRVDETDNYSDNTNTSQNAEDNETNMEEAVVSGSDEIAKLLKNMDVNEFVEVIVQEAADIVASFDKHACVNVLLSHGMDANKLLELGKVKFCKIVKGVIPMGPAVKIYMRIRRRCESEQDQM